MKRRELLKSLVAIGLIPNLGSANIKNKQLADDKRIKYVIIDGQKYALKPEIRMSFLENTQDFGSLELHIASFFAPQLNKKYNIEFAYLKGKFQLCGALIRYNLYSDLSSRLTFSNMEGRLSYA